jgi:uncharacterized membrane protein
MEGEGKQHAYNGLLGFDFFRRTEEHMKPKVAALFFISIVIFGAVVRFYRIDSKFYGNDEATTSLHVAGYTFADYRKLLDGRIRTAADLRLYQTIGRGTTYADTVRAEAVEDPQHPPLYYLLERAWVQHFGGSIAARRALSAIFGTLMLVAGGWLAFELFSWTGALVTLSLLAVSPFFVVYSQQTREYAMWGLVICISSALLLRTERQETPFLWLLYALSLTIGLYTDILTLLVMVAHFSYSIIGRRQNLMPILMAMGAALLLFSPWVPHMFNRDLASNDYLAQRLRPQIFMLKWLFNIGSIFLDAEYRVLNAGLLLLPIGAIIAFAVLALARANVRVRWFILTLTLLPALAFLIPDLILHESRSTSSRYLMPCWIGLELAVSYAITVMPSLFKNAALCLLWSCGLASIAYSSTQESWWADSGVAIGPISRTLNMSAMPLLVFRADARRWDFTAMELVSSVKPDARLQLFGPKATTPTITSVGNTYLLDPTPQLLQANKAILVYREVPPTNLGNLRAEAAAERTAQQRAAILDGSSLWRVVGQR